jgi:crotonobetainyl-CoA:carnitine CoA-transferase CaiB-like acyl-CoA transferase
MSLPLDDIRVIDLTVARAGPTCVRQLADWGADVIRVDAPVDPANPRLGGHHHTSDYQYVHRNKRSIALDLKTEVGHEVLMRLIDTADVVVENMRPGVKARLGFDWDVVHARNPRVVMGSISGFGQDGPYADRGGVDQIAQGMSGLMSVTGLPGQGPVRVGIPVSDLASGMFLAIAVLAALHDRDRTGEGRWVRTSLLEAMVSMMDFQTARWTIDGEVPGQEGNHHPTMMPMGCFETADGHLNIAGPSGRLWTKVLRRHRPPRPARRRPLRLRRQAPRAPVRAERDHRRPTSHPHHRRVGRCPSPRPVSLPVRSTRSTRPSPTPRSSTST